MGWVERMKKKMDIESWTDYDDYKDSLVVSGEISREEITEIEDGAASEVLLLRELQERLSQAIVERMAREKISFNELVRRTGLSRRIVSGAIKGTANLRLATLTRLCVALRCRPDELIH